MSEKPVMPISRALQSLSVPHLGEYFGVWAMEEQQLRSIVSAVTGVDLSAHVAHVATVPPAAALEVGYQELQGGIAMINLRGPLMKFRSSLSEGTGTVAARQAVRAAANAEEISGILLNIDSPGGTAAGTDGLAVEIAKAAKRKPVMAFIEDLGASAAYWVATSATKIMGGPTALVGSIGTFLVLYDFSAQAEALGIAVHVVKAGEFKGIGAPGAKISEPQLAEAQRVINELNENFIKAVAGGRRMGMEKARALADGRIHVGAAALGNGMVDAIGTFDDALSMLRREIKAMSAAAASKIKQESIMEPTNATPEPSPPTPPAPPAPSAPPRPSEGGGKNGPASMAEIKAALPNSTADFREHCVESGFTLTQASAAFARESKARQDAEESAPKRARTGTPPINMLDRSGAAGGSCSGDSLSRWNDAVAAKREKGMTPEAAVKAADKENPGLRESMLAEVNTTARRPLPGFRAA